MFLAILIAALCATLGLSEDIVVAVGNRLELIREGQQQEQVELGHFNATALVALTLDPTSRTLFFSDIKHHEASIFMMNLDGRTLAADVRQVVKKGGEESVEGLTFDTSGQTLVWTDRSQRLIRRVNITSHLSSDDSGATAEVIHFLGSDKPRSLVVDPCTKLLYWINWRLEDPCIERSFVNGSSREVIFSDDLLMPHGLTLDITEQRLYWVNNLQYSGFRIESGLVDGTDRREIYKGFGQFVFGLMMTVSHFYWTDWQNQRLWTLPRNISEGQVPQSIAHFDRKPMGLVVLGSVETECRSFSFTYRPVQSKQGHQEIQSEDEIEEEEEGVGKIPQLHFGKEVVDACHNYCLGGGNCSILDDSPKCSCPSGFYGNRCQVDLDSYVHYSPLSFLSSKFGTNHGLMIGIIVLGSACALLLILVVFLGVKVKRLSRRPKLRRRFVGVAKRKASAPSPVIDIENCCNMNLCETPCFEPPTRTPTSSSSPRKEKSEDKENLLLTDEDIAEP